MEINPRLQSPSDRLFSRLQRLIIRNMDRNIFHAIATGEIAQLSTESILGGISVAAEVQPQLSGRYLTIATG